jgi:hypothetical protein
MKRCHDPSELAPAPDPKNRRRRKTSSNTRREASQRGRSVHASIFENGSTINKDLGLNPFHNLSTSQAYPSEKRMRVGSKSPAPPTGPKGIGVAKARRPGSADRIRKMEDMIQRLGSRTSHDPAAKQLFEGLQRLHSENVREMMPLSSWETAHVSPQPIGPYHPTFSAINGDLFFPTD